MNANAFVIGLFVGKSEFTFTRHPDLHKRMLTEKKEVERDLGILELFPLTYKTDFYTSEGKIIAGTFDISIK